MQVWSTERGLMHDMHWAVESALYSGRSLAIFVYALAEFGTSIGA